ncbi:MAG: VPLPA-CTERM-specific exosortase XrtD [Pseudomonadota bacterium]
MTFWPGPSTDPGGATRTGGVILLGLAVASTIPLFWLGLGELLSAWTTPEYSHGPLIPLISLFLFLRELRARPPSSPTPKIVGPGITLGVFALVLAIFGQAIAIPDVVAYALILWVMALILLFMGWDAGRRHWAPVLHLVFMLPLPQILYWQLTTGLQTISAEVGVWLVRAADIPVLLEGHIIDLGIYQLQVAEACAGLRYLFPILSFSYLVAILYRGPFWHKAVIFALAAPIAVGLNAARIGVIGMLVDRHGISQAEGFLHVFEGWVIFGLCLVVLAGVAWALSRLRGVQADGPVLDLETAGLGQELSKARGLRPSMAVAGFLAATGILGAGQHLLAPPMADIPRAPFVRFDTDLGAWQGRQVALPRSVAQLLGADDYLDAAFQHPDHDAPVLLFSAWYANQNGGAGIHSPEVCLPAGGWEIAELHEVSVTIGTTFQINRAIVRQGLQSQLVYYWFEQQGDRMAGDWQAKLNAIGNQLTKGRSDGALVRLTTPILADETIADAEARLTDLAQTALPRLGAHLPL